MILKRKEWGHKERLCYNVQVPYLDFYVLLLTGRPVNVSLESDTKPKSEICPFGFLSLSLLTYRNKGSSISLWDVLRIQMRGLGTGLAGVRYSME